MQCAYNLVPSNLNGMILVIALEQQKQLFHVVVATQSEATSQIHLCRKAVHSDSLETMQEETPCNSAGLMNILIGKQIIVLSWSQMPNLHQFSLYQSLCVV